jgi:hypothetical protein
MSNIFQFFLKPKVATQSGTNFRIPKFYAKPLPNNWLLSLGLIGIATYPRHDLVEADFVASATLNMIG